MMENSLDMCLCDVLMKMQEQICSHNNTYQGIYCVKNPVDVWVYQQIIWETKPDVIIELGTFFGGSSVMFRDMLRNKGGGRVITIDPYHGWIDPRARQDGIEFIEATAVDGRSKINIHHGERVMIVEDSLHTYDCTLASLRAYSDIVTTGCYFIIEDTNFNHGIPGPPMVMLENGVEKIWWEYKEAYKQYEGYFAIDTFLSENKTFEMDRSREKFLITGNPKGFLKKK